MLVATDAGRILDGLIAEEEKGDWDAEVQQAFDYLAGCAGTVSAAVTRAEVKLDLV